MLSSPRTYHTLSAALSARGAASMPPVGSQLARSVSVSVAWFAMGGVVSWRAGVDGVAWLAVDGSDGVLEEMTACDHRAGINKARPGTTRHMKAPSRARGGMGTEEDADASRLSSSSTSGVNKPSGNECSSAEVSDRGDRLSGCAAPVGRVPINFLPSKTCICSILCS